MAWYYGTYSCGHEGRVNVIGKVSERQRKVDMHFSSLCKECQAKRWEEESKKAIEQSKEYEFPELSGTEKQIAWANTIRMEFYNYYDKYKIDVDDIIENETQSKFWIDNRNALTRDYFVNQYRKRHEKEEIDRLVISEDTIRPSDVKYDGVVEIVENGDKICLHYEKNQAFIDLVKSMKYKWDDVWYRKLSETTGTFADRAAEIGHKLLENGFCICIHDSDIAEKAIKGEYRNEHTRWVYSRRGTNLLSIRWNGRNDEIYQNARKIKGSKWDSGDVVVDVSHYKAVEEFAFKYGFKFTTAAQEKIDNYIEQMKQAKEAKIEN